MHFVSQISNVEKKKEPSSNVAPRTSGRKIEGSLIAIAALLRQAYLTCDATAFPVPVYRYFPVFSTGGGGGRVPTTFRAIAIKPKITRKEKKEHTKKLKKRRR
jgi:hypothetical protein